MASNYKEITRYNEEQLGRDISTRKSQVDMYSDFSHFVFEILQNADDYGAREISFDLFHDRLVIEHNGIPFEEENVRAISYFGKGTSAGDLVRTGRFGLGFKSVFSFTTTPQIHSGAEDFEIYDLYRLRPIKRPADLSDKATRIVLPFNHEKNKPVYVERIVSASKAFADISEKLRKLDHTTLLFTRNLAKISWSVNQTASDALMGEYTRKDLKKKKHGGKFEERFCEVICNSEKFNYLVFSTGMLSWENSDLRAVDIAFRIVEKDDEAVIVSEKKPLIVLFPTCVETHVGFLINAPLRTTPNRETVSHEDEFNRFLADKLAGLMTQALDCLAVRKLLNAAFYEMLPLRVEDFPVNHLLFPLFESVKTALMQTPLLLAHSGKLVAGNDVMIAESQKIRDLFTSEILQDVVDARLKSEWLTGDITANKTPSAYVYFKNVLKLKEWTFEDIFKTLTESFYSKRTDEWMIDFYLYVNEQASLWRKQGSIARRLPFIRTENDEHIAPFSEENDPLVFLPTHSGSELKTVKQNLLENHDVLGFLQKLGIHEADIFGEILGTILPKYADPKSREKISAAENDRDLSLIIRAMKDDTKTDSKSDLALLRKCIATLHKTGDPIWQSFSEEIIEKVFANSPRSQVLSILILHSGLQIFRSKNYLGVGKGLRGAKSLYLTIKDNAGYFKNNGEINFVDPDYDDDLLILLSNNVYPRICANLSKVVDEGAVIISSTKPFKRALAGFDPYTEVDGLRFALENNLNMETSRFIWNHVALPNRGQIRGEIEISDYKSYKGSKKEVQYSVLGKLLTSFLWLPDKNNQMRRPAELSLSDLPEGFETASDEAKELSLLLGMIGDDQVAMLSQLCGGDSEMKDILMQAMSLPPGPARDEAKKLLTKLLSQNVTSSSEVAPAIKIVRLQKGQPPQATTVTTQVKNPARYKERLTQIFNDKHKNAEPQAKKGVFVKAATEESREARNFLYQEYRGRCQITGNTFLKASANSNGVSSFYFEAVKLAVFSDNRSNDAGNLLCLSADSFARFKYASIEQIDTFEQVISEFKAGSMQAAEVKMRIKLAGEDATISWSQRHFVRFLNIYETFNPSLS